MASTASTGGRLGGQTGLIVRSESTGTVEAEKPPGGGIAGRQLKAGGVFD